MAPYGKFSTCIINSTFAFGKRIFSTSNSDGALTTRQAAKLITEAYTMQAFVANTDLAALSVRCPAIVGVTMVTTSLMI